MLIPDLEQQERTARSLPVQQNDPKRTETDTISRNIMNLDDLTWALTEEQKRCIEGAKNDTLTPEMKGFFLGEANACSKALAWIDKVFETNYISPR